MTVYVSSSKHESRQSAEYTTTQAEIMYQPHEFREVSEVGEFIYDESTGIWVRSVTILYVRFEDKNMYVKYEFAPVVEWSNKERCKRR